MERYQFLLKNLVMAQMMLHTTDPGSTGGGGGGHDPASAFQALLKKHNDNATEVASKLFDENYQYRVQIRDLKAAAPKEGSVVLSADDAKEWQAFKALDKKADDVKKAIESLSTLETQNRELSAMENLREIAELGLEGSKLKLSVLKDQLARFPEAVISFKTEKDKDGKEAKVAYIKKTEKDSETKFEDFAKADLVDYLPSLKVSSEANTPTPLGNGPDPSSNNRSTSVFDQIREKQKAKIEAEKPVADMDINARFGRPAAA